MLHMIKMAAGVRDLAQFQRSVAARGAGGGPMFVRTRNMPKRAAEMTDGGSLFWVFSGAIQARQLFRDISQAEDTDGSKFALLELDPVLVPVIHKPCKPMQGWRYLEASAAPADIGSAGETQGVEDLPESLRRELSALGLI